jgi:hypothetical protein
MMEVSLVDLSADVEVMQTLTEKMADALAEMQAVINEAILELRTDR